MVKSKAPGSIFSENPNIGVLFQPKCRQKPRQCLSFVFESPSASGRTVKTKLAERVENPRVASAALSDAPDIFKIKITTPQFRLAYHVDDAQRRVTILAVTSRDDVYDALADRLKK